MQFSPEIAENVRGSEDDSVVVFLSVFSQDIDAYDIAKALENTARPPERHKNSSTTKFISAFVRRP